MKSYEQNLSTNRERERVNLAPEFFNFATDFLVLTNKRRLMVFFVFKK